MSDETTAPELQDSPELEGGPDSGTPATEAPVTYSQEEYQAAVTRAEDNQAWGTKSSQEAAALRGLYEAARSEDPEERQWAASQLFPDVEFEWADPEQQPGETNAQHERRMAEMQQEIADLKTHAELGSYNTYCNEAIDAIEAHLGYELSDEDAEDLVTIAEKLGDGQTPDWTAAVDRWQARIENAGQKYLASKEAPHNPKGGQAGSEKFDIKNEDERQAVMAAIASAHQE